eukprot:TRINITY_DN5632_c0_g1_i3.p1 TRINITY_DN5632_c0_g1~~TRINITY_DN5632_c0_g1_i3.p1  ORF type:complete len:143 (+),score=40.53 TRINITY_DN5632_c0_g1_i3:298-726(+)
MCEVFQHKVETKGIDNVNVRCLTLDREDQLGQTFDVVFMNLTLHHIEDPASIIRLLAHYVAKDGHLLIFDLVKTEISPLFHPRSKWDGVFFHGFTIDELKAWANATGSFSSVEVVQVYTVDKVDDEGCMRTHPVQVLKAKKM